MEACNPLYRNRQARLTFILHTNILKDKQLLVYFQLPHSRIPRCFQVIL